MLAVLQFFILTVLVFITYDDLKHRRVRVFLFPLLAALLLIDQGSRFSWSDVGMNIILNIAYIAVLLGACYVYLLVKHKTSVLSSYIGVGDLLLLVCLAVWFFPIYFILFNTVSFIVALALHSGLSRVSKAYQQFQTVPLAGFQSVCFGVVIIVGLMNSVGS